MSKEQTIHIRYYALLREERGVSDETLKTLAQTPKELYKELGDRYNFRLKENLLKVAVNDSFANWDAPLKNNDTVVFIPPVSGG